MRRLRESPLIFIFKSFLNQEKILKLESEYPDFQIWSKSETTI